MRPSLVVRLFAAFLAIAAVPSVSNADQLFAGNFVSTTISVTPTEDGMLVFDTTAKGRATIIGKFTGTAQYLVNPVDGSFTGVITKVGANGDELREAFIGQFNEDFTESFGIFWINGGTGKLRKAKGIGFFSGEATSPTTIDVDLFAK